MRLDRPLARLAVAALALVALTACAGGQEPSTPEATVTMTPPTEPVIGATSPSP